MVDEWYNILYRRQEKIVLPQLRMCSMEGKAETLFCLLEDGDNVNLKVCEIMCHLKVNLILRLIVIQFTCILF